MSFSHALPAELLRTLGRQVETLWLNEGYRPDARATLAGDETMVDAKQRFDRHAKVLQSIFPELADLGGRIESHLQPVAALREALMPNMGGAGEWFLKGDHALPVAGSVKARGGFHEVLTLAEALLERYGAEQGGEPPQLGSEQARALFSRHTVAVGSTGNLGLAIGMISAALGFRAVVHMSADAKQWKKDRLRSRGIEVVEHPGDYARAVAAGRAAADGDANAHFVDDEHSLSLFLGYSVAAFELENQLKAAGRSVDAQHPLFVYLPCGVGGAPGGIAYGLKQRFGGNVHCFFAEPVASPCMLVQLASGQDAPVSVYDIGLDNRTEADGLAVGLASPLVAPLMKTLLAGIFTVADDRLFRDIHTLKQTTGVLIEPSAAAGFSGPRWLLASPAGQAFQAQQGLENAIQNATHVLWSTGGSLVPASEHQRFQEKGRKLLADD